MKKLKIITEKISEIDPNKRLKPILGKKVIGINGEIVGKVKSLIGNSNKIEGIIITKKRLCTFIDYIHIQDLYTTSIMLKINPVSRLIGLKVFDSEGRYIGKVIDFIQIEHKNDFSEIIVKKGIFSKRQNISKENIEIATKNILLNSNIEEKI